MSTPREDKIASYVECGYTRLNISGLSGTGTDLLVNISKGRAVKFNSDPAYDVFVGEARKNPEFRVPFIHTYEPELRSGTFVFSVTEMELLSPLDEGEAEAVRRWYESVTGDDPSTFEGQEPIDELGLNDTYQWLRNIAIGRNVELDLGKTSNYMARGEGKGRVVVVIDPFSTRPRTGDVYESSFFL